MRVGVSNSLNTIGGIVAKLEDSFEFARANRNPSAMVAAAMGQARVLGLILGRKQQAIKRIDDMTASELRALLGNEDAGTH